MTILTVLFPTTAALLGGGMLPAQQLEVLPVEEETRLALSAAPSHLRDGAGVLALTEQGFLEIRPSTNGFTCVVNRDHPLSRKPTCYDRVGTTAILPKVRFVGELLLEGIPLDEIEARVAAKFAAGDFGPAAGPGVAYMLSSETRRYDPQTGQATGFPPHVMFYAPDLTNVDIGTSWPALRDQPWLPFVGYEGPHGFLIIVVEAEAP